MNINHKIEYVEGPFDTTKGKLVCVMHDKYADVSLCFKANMNIPFAKIKLFTKDLFVDAEATMEDAYKLGNEIVKRWNDNNQINKLTAEFIKRKGFVLGDTIKEDGFYYEHYTHPVFNELTIFFNYYDDKSITYDIELHGQEIFNTGEKELLILMGVLRKPVPTRPSVRIKPVTSNL